MGHYDEQYESAHEKIRAENEALVRQAHKEMPMPEDINDVAKQALLFLLDQLGVHGKDGRTRTMARMHHGRLNGELT